MNAQAVTSVTQAQNNAEVKQRANDAAMRVYRFVVRYKQRHDGCSPSLREIVGRLNLSSTSMAAYYLDMLEVDGLIRRSDIDGVASRCIEIVGGRWIAPGETR